MYPVPPRPETQGLTETYVGNWLAKHGSREKLIIASKVSGPSRNNDKGIRPDQALNRKNIREALHNSLSAYRLITSIFIRCTGRSARPTASANSVIAGRILRLRFRC